MQVIFATLFALVVIFAGIPGRVSRWWPACAVLRFLAFGMFATYDACAGAVAVRDGETGYAAAYFAFAVVWIVSTCGLAGQIRGYWRGRAYTNTTGPF